tara:strand:- start:2 stop:199 length:198 start_codon:yes stop_codon:yes gene_type:complete
MQDPLEDRTVIILILATLLLVFILIFSQRPSQNYLNPSIEWKDAPSLNNNENLNIRQKQNESDFI